MSLWQILLMIIQYIHTKNGINELIKLLEKEHKSTIDWFKNNNVIVNLDKFQAMVLSCEKKNIYIL